MRSVRGLLAAGGGKTKLLGFGLIPVVLIKLPNYGFSLFGGSIYDMAPILKAAMQLPFVRFPFECTKKRTRAARTAALLSPSATTG